jgi:arginyl-tRNA--protein-N-Asp/Glu arginylyltransferase
MLYRIEGKIIAVGVVDITPHMMISIYFYYLPFLKEIDLGFNTVAIE